LSRNVGKKLIPGSNTINVAQASQKNVNMNIKYGLLKNTHIYSNSNKINAQDLQKERKIDYSTKNGNTIDIEKAQKTDRISLLSSVNIKSFDKLDFSKSIGLNHDQLNKNQYMIYNF
jgi:hypothetical protein